MRYILVIFYYFGCNLLEFMVFSEETFINIIFRALIKWRKKTAAQLSLADKLRFAPSAGSTTRLNFQTDDGNQIKSTNSRLGVMNCLLIFSFRIIYPSPLIFLFWISSVAQRVSTMFSEKPRTFFRSRNYVF